MHGQQASSEHHVKINPLTRLMNVTRSIVVTDSVLISLSTVNSLQNGRLLFHDTNGKVYANAGRVH